MPLFKLSILASLLLIAQTSAAMGEGTPAWLQATRELGAFGLVAFIVWWYATHVAPDAQKQSLLALAESRAANDASQAHFLKAFGEQRTDYLASQDKQRADYLKSRDEDRTTMNLLATSIQQLASATQMHVAQAQLVWEKQGWIKPSGQQTKA